MKGILRLWAIGLVVAMFLAAGPANAQAIIKVSDTVTLRFGAILQVQGDWLQTANATETTGYQQNLYIRRARLLFGGQIASDVYFFMDTENSKLGLNKTGTSALGSGFQLLDGFGEWRPSNAFILDAGLMLVPYSREALTSSGSIFFFDLSAYAFLQQTGTQNTGGNRDTGFQARGYFADDRLEYRVGVFQGERLTGSHNAFRVSGRLQLELLDREAMHSPGGIYSLAYAGYYSGDKSILALGAGLDTQMDYNYYSGDLFASIPTGKSGAINAKFQYQYVNGGTTFTTLPTENTEQVDLGYYIKDMKVAPVVRWEQRVYNGAEAKNETRYGFGLNYYPYGNNFNIKAVFNRVDPKTGVSTNEFAIQLQFFYF